MIGAGWFTVVAQIINFLILVLLLTLSLRACHQGHGQREALIAAELEAAETKQKEAQLEIETYRQKNQALDIARAEMMQRAGDEVENWRQNATKRPFTVEESRQHWQRALEQEKDTFLHQVRQRACPGPLSSRARCWPIWPMRSWRNVEVFTTRLNSVNGSQLEALSASLRQSEGEVVITSAFDLSEEMRKQVRAVVEERLGQVNGMRFETSPRLVSIELKTQRHRLAWSMADTWMPWKYTISSRSEFPQCRSGELGS